MKNKLFSIPILIFAMFGVIRYTPAQDSWNQYFSKYRLLEDYTGSPPHHNYFSTGGARGEPSFSPDSTTLAVPGTRRANGPDSMALQIWDIATGETVIIDGPLASSRFSWVRYHDSDFSPDGRTLVAATDDPWNNVILWDVVAKQYKSIDTDNWVYAVSFSPDGSTLALATEPRLILLDVATGQRRTIERLWQTNSMAISFSPDGSMLAENGPARVRLWNVSTLQLQKTLEWPGAGFMNTVIFSPDGSTLIAGAANGAAVWDLSTGQHIATMHWPYPAGGCKSVSLSPDGTTLAAVGYTGVERHPTYASATGNALVLWDVATGERKITLEFGSEEQGTPRRVSFSPDGTMLAAINFKMHLWHLKNPLPPLLRNPFLPLHSASEPMSIPDRNLATAVRKALGLDLNSPITRYAMRRLTTLEARQSQIKSLKGLEHATQLITLDLNNNQIRDLSPLSGLTHLKELRLDENQINYTYSLIGLKQLEELHLSGNQLKNRDVRLLANLTELRMLSLNGNQIGNIKPFASLAKLEGLWLEENKIRDVSPLAGLVNLEVLKLKGNLVKDFSPLANLPNLRETDIDIPDSPNVSKGVIPDANLAKAVRKALGLKANVPITKQAMQKLIEIHAREKNIRNLTGLEHATQLRTLNLADNQISDLRPLAKLKQLRGISLFRNQISDLRPLANLTQLTWLDLGGNQIKDITSLKRLVQLDTLFLWRNQISNLRSLTGLKRLRKLYLYNNKINNVTPLAKLTQLKELRLQNNQISKVIPLAKLVNLETLYLKGNPIQDTSPLRNLPKLKEVDFDIPGQAAPVLVTSAAPDHTLLLANYPNPFNPETWIPYQLAAPSDVKITIYDMHGVVVRQLALGHQPVGTYISRSRAAYWDGCNNQGERVASGIYFYQLETGTISSTRKMLILK